MHGLTTICGEASFGARQQWTSDSRGIRTFASVPFRLPQAREGARTVISPGPRIVPTAQLLFDFTWERRRSDTTEASIEVPRTPRSTLSTPATLAAFGVAALIGAALIVIERPSRPHPFSIPPYSQLVSVSGILQENVYLQAARDHSAFGRLLTDGGNVIELSCDAQLRDLDCLYTRSWFNSDRIGKRVEVKYFIYPYLKYPDYSNFAEVTPIPNGRLSIRQPLRIVMEVKEGADSGARTLVSYQDSQRRLGGG